MAYSGREHSYINIIIKLFFINNVHILRSTVKSHYYGHPRDQTLVSAIASVRNSGSSLQSFLCSVIELGIYNVSVIGRCP